MDFFFFFKLNGKVVKILNVPKLWTATKYAFIKVRWLLNGVEQKNHIVIFHYTMKA